MPEWEPVVGVARAPWRTDIEMHNGSTGQMMTAQINSLAGWFREARPVHLFVSADRTRLRLGNREASAASLTRSSHYPGDDYAVHDDYTARPPTVDGTTQLRVGTDDGFVFMAPLDSSRAWSIDSATRDVLVEILQLSSIVIPTDSFDPRRRFARSAHPYNLTKEETIDFLRDFPLRSAAGLDEE